MRVVSLVPHATELLFALGVGPEMVAVTHECDYPAAALELPRVTRDVLAPGLDAAEVDAAVRERTLGGEAIYELDRAALTALEPELIVTQALCPVCAVSYEEVAELARGMSRRPQVIALDPKTVDETLADVGTLAEATARRERGAALVRDAAARIERVKLAVRAAERRPRVAALEWLDPVFIAGHWTPELIELAGGEDVLGVAGEPSSTASWETLAAAAPEVVVAMPCGYDAARARAEAQAHRSELSRLNCRVVAVDASAYFSRPGPRLIDGLELLAKVLHPQLAPEPPPGVQALTVLD
ncbi:MAG: iron complex transport system substrate-binding protein [Solirubrobacteraceae bacterium]|nr:iron complex transport system substrate-binding protein [Solirubrobacteraceae bacterium]